MSPPSRRGATRGPEARAVTDRLLREWPLPWPDAEGDKEARGRTLVVGGAATLPGALVLAGTAVLRAGAGKLQLATTQPIAVQVGVAVPEALVLGLPESGGGGIAPRAAGKLADYANRADALLIGPGMVDDWAISRLLARLLPAVERPVVVLDAGALGALASLGSAAEALRGRVVITPHAGEMASLLGDDEEEIERDPADAARRAAKQFGAVAVLKGGETVIADPEGTLLRYDRGKVGLATSGSGDTLAGVVAGLVARGAPPMQAAAWGVYLHGAAGNALARRVGPLGYLARELHDEVPRVMAALAKKGGAA